MPVKRSEAGLIMSSGINDLFEHSEAADILQLYMQCRSLGFMVFNFIPLNVLLVLGGVDFYMEDSIFPQFLAPAGNVCL